MITMGTRRTLAAIVAAVLVAAARPALAQGGPIPDVSTQGLPTSTVNLQTGQCFAVNGDTYLCRAAANVWNVGNANPPTTFSRFVWGANDASTNGISLQLVSGIPLFKSGDGSTSRGMAAPSFFASDGTNNIMTADGGPIFGSSNASLAGRNRTSMATPASLANGDFWLESNTGAITGASAALKAQLNGSTVLVAPAIRSTGRATAQTAANASVATYTLGAADASFEVSANVLVTTATTHSFTVECAYTDEGNTARVLTMNFMLLANTSMVASIVNANGAVPYLGVPAHIRAKASTAITIRTQAAGTYTTVTYNVEGSIRQISP